MSDGSVFVNDKLKPVSKVDVTAAQKEFFDQSERDIVSIIAQFTAEGKRIGIVSFKWVRQRTEEALKGGIFVFEKVEYTAGNIVNKTAEVIHSGVNDAMEVAHKVGELLGF